MYIKIYVKNNFYSFFLYIFELVFVEYVLKRIKDKWGLYFVNGYDLFFL